MPLRNPNRGLAAPATHRLNAKGIYVPSGGVALVALLAYGSGGAHSATQTFTVPAGLQNDDFVYHYTHCIDDNNRDFTLAGFTTHLSLGATSGSPDRGQFSSYKVITDAATEIAGGTWEFTEGTGSECAGFVWVLRGVNTSSHIDSTVAWYGTTSSKVDPFKTWNNGGGLLNADSYFLTCSTGGTSSSSGSPDVSAAPSHLTYWINQGAGASGNNRVFGAAGMVYGAAGTAMTQDDYTMSDNGVGYTSCEMLVGINVA